LIKVIVTDVRERERQFVVNTEFSSKIRITSGRYWKSSG